MSHVILLFIDGIGLGENDPHKNPFAAHRVTFGTGTSLFSPLGPSKKNVIIIPTDASLNIPGLPQSATGQSTILTGINAAALLGHHLQAYPNKRLAQLLAEKGIFTWCRDNGFSATFANGFRKEYWTWVAERKLRHSATTLAFLGADGIFRNESAFENGEAVYHDLTGQALHRLGKKIPLISPQEAGTRIARIAQKNKFTLFEYFMTDKIGHQRQWDTAGSILYDLDTFIQSLLGKINPDQTTVILTSDHGNFEDFSTKSHTTNFVPTIIYGQSGQHYKTKIKSLMDIVPTIQSLLLKNI